MEDTAGVVSSSDGQGRVLALQARNRLPADVGAELLDALADGPGVVMCDLSGMAAAGLTAVVQAFAPASHYLRYWHGTSLILYSPDPGVCAALRSAALGRDVIVGDSYDGTIARARAEHPDVELAGLRLAPWPASCPEARRFVRRTLDDWRLPGLEEAASLVVTELVTNAIVHAGTVLHLTVARAERQVRLAVRDNGGGRAAAEELIAHDSTLHGRGLVLVEAFTRGWGVLPARSRGKTVWAVLESRDEE